MAAFESYPFISKQLPFEAESKTAFSPQNLPEKLIWSYIVYNIPIYYLGLQFVLAPLLAYVLTGYLIFKEWQQTEETPAQEKIRLSDAAWVWIACVLIIAIALLVGSFDFEISSGKILNSIINRWLRTYVLLALFPLIGHLRIRPQIIFRAACILGIQLLILSVIFILAIFLKIPETSFISPFSVFGGGIKFYTVNVFGFVNDVDSIRLVMNAPWAPALGLFGNAIFILCLPEQNWKLKSFGIAGSLVVIAGSFSRAAILCLPCSLLIYFLTQKFSKTYFFFITGIVSFLATLLWDRITQTVDEMITSFRGLRQASSESRDKLGELALNAWQNEAFVWGHGTFAEQGPALVHGLAIGSHHTWYGVLYLHGLVGGLALAVAFIWSVWSLVLKIGTGRYAPLGLSILGILLLFSMGENIESLAYLYWPILVVLGIAFNEPEFESQ